MKSVALFVQIPRSLRKRVRVAAAEQELTIAEFVAVALDSATRLASRSSNAEE